VVIVRGISPYVHILFLWQEMEDISFVSKFRETDVFRESSLEGGVSVDAFSVFGQDRDASDHRCGEG